MITSNLTDSFEIPEQLSAISDMIKNGVEGTYPTGTTGVSNTAEVATVRNSDGTELQGLELRVLDEDQSNLPGENTSGTTGTAGPGVSNPSSTSSSGGSSSTGGSD